MLQYNSEITSLLAELAVPKKYQADANILVCETTDKKQQPSLPSQPTNTENKSWKQPENVTNIKEQMKEKLSVKQMQLLPPLIFYLFTHER